jgi:hypothetical protein
VDSDNDIVPSTTDIAVPNVASSAGQDEQAKQQKRVRRQTHLVAHDDFNAKKMFFSTLT